MMYGEGELDSVFEIISRSIAMPVECYLIGGLAMIKNGMKIATKDIDIVFSDEFGAREFIRAAAETGFSPDTELPPEYGEMRAMMVIKDCNDNRIDLFVGNVMGDLEYSEGMRSRSRAMNYGKLLRVNVSSNEDIFLFKSVTSRPADIRDMEILARTGALDWETIEAEAREQPTPWKWIGRLYGRLMELEAGTDIETPLTDRLAREAEIAQAIGIVLGRKIQHTCQNLKEILMEDDDFIEEVMEYMRTHGL